MKKVEKAFFVLDRSTYLMALSTSASMPGRDAWSRGGVDNEDYVRLYSIVDGGKETLVGEIKGKQSEMTTITGTASGERIVLEIRAKVSSEDEIFVLDNLKVTQR